MRLFVLKSSLVKIFSEDLFGHGQLGSARVVTFQHYLYFLEIPVLLQIGLVCKCMPVPERTLTKVVPNKAPKMESLG